MAVSEVTSQSAVGIDGNAYTTAVANDQLTSEDFLKLMLEEMKMQDPTKPMDSQQLMDSQLKMSTIESNLTMAESMEALKASYSASALSTAANLINSVVENGETNDSGEVAQYVVDTVENKDGDLYVNTYEVIGIRDGLYDNENEQLVLYDADGYIYDTDGETKTEYRVALDANGRFTYNEDGTLKIVDEDNEVVTDEDVVAKYVYAASSPIYAEEVTTMPISNITKVS